MVMLTWFTFVSYVALITLTFFYQRAVKDEKSAETLANLKLWQRLSIVASVTGIVAVMAGCLYHAFAGTTWPRGAIDWCLNIAIAISILQSDAGKYWRGFSYAVIVIAALGLIGSLAGWIATSNGAVAW